MYGLLYTFPAQRRDLSVDRNSILLGELFGVDGRDCLAGSGLHEVMLVPDECQDAVRWRMLSNSVNPLLRQFQRLSASNIVDNDGTVSSVELHLREVEVGIGPIRVPELQLHPRLEVNGLEETRIFANLNLLGGHGHVLASLAAPAFIFLVLIDRSHFLLFHRRNRLVGLDFL